VNFYRLVNNKGAHIVTNESINVIMKSAIQNYANYITLPCNNEFVIFLLFKAHTYSVWMEK